MATKESVTGFTEVLQKTEVIPESIGLVIMKAQAGITTNLVLSSFKGVELQDFFLAVVAALENTPKENVSSARTRESGLGTILFG